MNSDPETESQRVRRHTSPQQLDQIDRQIERNLRFYGSQPEAVLTRRIEQLNQEWSIERWLSTNAAVLALSGASLSLLFGKKKWLLLSAAVSGFLLQHALSGWCPPVPLLRRLGIRTQSEIDREKFGLKALRGDFDKIEISERRAEISRKRPKVVTA
jgi:Protein of unknown function (DUF2892)